jgi:hypothetical protein
MNDIKDFLRWLGRRFLEAINPFHPEYVRPTWEDGKRHGTEKKVKENCTCEADGPFRCLVHC